MHKENKLQILIIFPSVLKKLGILLYIVQYVLPRVLKVKATMKAPVNPSLGSYLNLNKLLFEHIPNTVENLVEIGVVVPRKCSIIVSRILIHNCRTNNG